MSDKMIGVVNFDKKPHSVELRELPVPGATLRAYGFADGHSELHKSETGDFRDWEAQHIIAPQNQ